MIYYKDPATSMWKPERRQSAHPSPTREQRRQDSGRTTSEQYTFLKDWLIRREEMHSRVARRGRVIRHVLATISLVYIALFFSQPNFTLQFNAIGFTQEITLVQIGAIAPLLIAYLVLHACHLGLTRLKLIHECRVVERELQRFGLDTGYSLLGKWRGYCQSRKEFKNHYLSMTSMSLVYWLYDGFLTISVLTSFYVSALLAFKSYSGLYNSSPHTAILFIVFLITAATSSIIAIIALRFCRTRLDKFLDEYLTLSLKTQEKKAPEQAREIA